MAREVYKNRHRLHLHKVIFTTWRSWRNVPISLLETLKNAQSICGVINKNGGATHKPFLSSVFWVLLKTSLDSTMLNINFCNFSTGLKILIQSVLTSPWRGERRWMICKQISMRSSRRINSWSWRQRGTGTEVCAQRKRVDKAVTGCTYSVK